MSIETSAVHDMCVAYALHGLDPMEALRYEAHLADCEPCRGDVADLRDAAELLSQDAEITPPESIREQLLTITQVPVEPEPSGAETTLAPLTRSGTHSKRRRWFGR